MYRKRVNELTPYIILGDSSDAEHSQDESTLQSTQKLIENQLNAFLK